jgi:PAS domain S-box-containing protein
MNDTTSAELRRLNRLYHASSRVSQAMVRAPSGEKVALQICQRLVNDGGFVLAWMGRRDAQTDALVPLCWSGTTGCDANQVLPPADGGAGAQSLAQAALSESKTVVWNDYAAASLALPGGPSAKNGGRGAAAAFPIQCAEGAPGVLCLYSSELNFFGGKELSLLEELAENVSQGLQHLEQEARQKAELSSERGFLHALMDNSWNFIYFKDLSSRFIRCSRAVHERFGLTHDQIIGKSDFDFFSDEHAQQAFADEQNIIRTGEAMVGKIEKETWKGGKDSWCITAKMPLRNDDGKIIGTMGISKDLTAVKEAEAKLAEMHGQLVEASRVAGMAEVATSILHNVGNVLNSVNVSSSVLGEKIRNSRIANVAKVASLLKENAADLPGFLASPKGRPLPSYLSELATHLAAEREEMLRELQFLASNIEHIKEIVAAQQGYARTAGVVESIRLPDLVDDALEMHKGALGRHSIKVIREYNDTPPILVDKHKVLQILINLLHNSKYAVDEGAPPEKRVIVRVENQVPDHVRVSVIDNGIGIPKEHLSRVFEHGFTTRKDGHGFGLHSGAITARELGGALTAHSEGLGRGAQFVLELPVEPRKTTL